MIREQMEIALRIVTSVGVQTRGREAQCNWKAASFEYKKDLERLNHGCL